MGGVLGLIFMFEACIMRVCTSTRLPVCWRLAVASLPHRCLWHLATASSLKRVWDRPT